jgi:carbamate kinase
MRVGSSTAGTAVIAIGGNSLIRAGETTSVATESAHVVETCRAIAAIAARGWQLVITHGNGPQVGAALRRSELAAPEAYPLPLDVCVASTQGEIGVLLQQGLADACRTQGVARPVATVLTQVVVDPSDAAFARPTKPIGPFYSLIADAERLRRSGCTLLEQPPHGYRRVVASPEPLEVVEEPAIRALLDAGVIVVALGGGGVPVVRRDGGLHGIEAVVDKDLASALLAMRLHADVFVLSTDVEGIYLNFDRPDAKLLREVTDEELAGLTAAGHFPPGTMGPKVKAIERFLRAGGREAIVTSPDRLVAALDGRAGTRIRHARKAAAAREESESSWSAYGR